MARKRKGGVGNLAKVLLVGIAIILLVALLGFYLSYYVPGPPFPNAECIGNTVFFCNNPAPSSNGTLDVSIEQALSKTPIYNVMLACIAYPPNPAMLPTISEWQPISENGVAEPRSYSGRLLNLPLGVHVNISALICYSVNGSALSARPRTGATFTAQLYVNYTNTTAARTVSNPGTSSLLGSLYIHIVKPLNVFQRIQYGLGYLLCLLSGCPNPA